VLKRSAWGPEHCAASPEQLDMTDQNSWPEVIQNTLQHTATHYSTLQHTAAHSSELQHTPAHSSTGIVGYDRPKYLAIQNTLQHTAAHCNMLQHTATRCSTLQHTAAHCSTLQHTPSHCITGTVAYELRIAGLG